MDRWQQIGHLVQAALAREPNERGAFLATACGGDDDLRRQVESLLVAADETRNVQTSRFARPPRPFPATPLVAAGVRLARYTVVAKLGAGGMGEVYRARDDQLGRDVAVKVLPSSSFHDVAARARLVREARAAAALNHPNICHVYEVGEADGQAYIAMELVDGQTLSAKLAGGPLPIERVVHYGLQLADALMHAHDRGVIHRDLKSQNVIVTSDDLVKVLDFGLAKRLSDTDMAATVTQDQALLTQPGVAVGTLPYMSPEQLRGGEAKASSDIWALGVVLYEMASGTRPFGGQTPFEVSAAILNDAPAPLPAGIPPGLRLVIESCLVKGPVERCPSAVKLRAALLASPAISSDDGRRSPGDESGRSVSEAVQAPTSLMRFAVTRRQAVWTGGAAVLGVASGLVLWDRQVGRSPVRTLAVLPLANPAEDEDLEYLCDGIAESLIQRVSTLRMIRVRPLRAVLDLKGASTNPQSVGRQLGVEMVLVGTLARPDERLRIDAQLVDVASGRQLWTGTYDRAAAALLDLQDEIASAIMGAGLAVRLTDTERQQLVRHPTTDGDAYDLYLQARYLQRRATEDDYLYSRSLLERAVVRDPNFALAYAALAGNYAMMTTDGLERPTDAWPLVSKYSRQALAVDPSLPEGLVFEHAIAFLFDWDWAGAARARERFLASPVGDFDPEFLRAMAMEHWALGRLDQALALARRTRELAPRSPYLAILEADYLLRANQLDGAVTLYDFAIRGEPDNPNAYFGLAEALSRLGRFDEAIAARRKAHDAAGDGALAAIMASARGESGYLAVERAWVRLQLSQLQARAVTSYVSPLDLARAYAQLGEADLAFRSVDAAFADRSPGLVFLKVDPAWNSMRSDARFAAAVRLVGLP